MGKVLATKSHGKSQDKSHGRLTIGATAKPRELIQDNPHVKGAWMARIVTLFPEAFPGVLGASLTGKALKDGKWAIDTVDLRMFGEGKHKNVDDTPAGGGAGMVMRADVVGNALAFAGRNTPRDRAKWPVVYMSPRGKPFAQADAERFAAADGITILCGRFEGVDERVLEHFDVEEISLGDFVMTGGEIPAQAVIDATVRLLPEVLGNADSAVEESFSNGLLEHPQYTRPATWEGREIPAVLTSGNHAKVDEWRQDMGEKLTQQRRPDLWEKYLDQKKK